MNGLRRSRQHGEQHKAYQPAEKAGSPHARPLCCSLKKIAGSGRYQNALRLATTTPIAFPPVAAKLNQ